MELLAPAGSEEALYAAAEAGADAIYIGGSNFSARRSAKNFSNEDIKKASEYCRIRNIALHVAANILVKEKECNEFIDYVGALNEIGIDALIIQDIGMASKIKRIFPDLPLHASTQLTAASLDAVRFLEKRGFSRVVLSRELSRKEIEYICKNSEAEIEVFAHGALCMSYSGQCLMSSLIGGRSGNRGMCAQPCRLPYELEDAKGTVNKGYLLSPKDLSLIDELRTLRDAGVDSLKLEGRLKRPEYVSSVVSTYKRVINSDFVCGEGDKQILRDAFNRSGFTKGYYMGKTGLDMMSINTPGNVAKSNPAPQGIREKKTELDMYISIRLNEAASLTVTDGDFNCVTVTGEIKGEPAIVKPLEKERVISQLSKLGGTIFETRCTEAEIEEGVSLPISEINNLRRKAICELEKIRCERKKYRDLRPDVENDIKPPQERAEKIFSAKVENIKQANAVIACGVKRIYAPSEICERIKKDKPEIETITVLPPVWRGKNTGEYYIADGVLVSNIGEAEHFCDYPLFGDTRLNIASSESIKHYSFLKSAAVSQELNIGELKVLKPYIPLEAVVYGRQQLMVCENCPAKMNNRCGERVYLKDRRNERFPLMCAPGCYCVVLNSKPLYMADKMRDFNTLPIDIYRFEFTFETEEECKKIIDAYKKGINIMKENSFTRGHYYRGVE